MVFTTSRKRGPMKRLTKTIGGQGRNTPPNRGQGCPSEAANLSIRSLRSRSTHQSEKKGTFAGSYPLSRQSKLGYAEMKAKRDHPPGPKITGDHEPTELVNLFAGFGSRGHDLSDSDRASANRLRAVPQE